MRHLLFLSLTFLFFSLNSSTVLAQAKCNPANCKTACKKICTAASNTSNAKTAALLDPIGTSEKTSCQKQVNQSTKTAVKSTCGSKSNVKTAALLDPMKTFEKAGCQKHVNQSTKTAAKPACGSISNAKTAALITSNESTEKVSCQKQVNQSTETAVKAVLVGNEAKASAPAKASCQKAKAACSVKKE